MTLHIFLVIGSLLFSALCGFLAIPLIQNFCQEKKLFDMPDARKVHQSSIPRLGGISFLPSMFIAFLATSLTYNTFTGISQVTFSLWTLYFFVSLMLIYGVGIVDDIVGLKANVKFLVQIIASLLLPLAGLYFNNFYGFLGIHEVPFYIGMPLTIFIIVYVTNAINLIDGIDGLAAGISLIALSGFLVCFINEGLWLYSILIAGLIGVLLAFMYYNLFGDAEKHRKIFMGDSGSLTLGFILGFLATKYSMDNPLVMFWRPDCMLLSYTFLIVPIYDLVRVASSRYFHHIPAFKADKNHIHHKLMRAGLNQRQALLCILSLAILFIIINVSLTNSLSSTLIVCIDIVVWIVFHKVLNYFIRKKGKEVFVITKEEER